MEHSISRVARMAGVSARTLRHYHDIGLLVPARVADNGYRYYGRRELLRLQRILLMRRLGMPLPDIATALDGTSDELTALRRHREQVAAERDRLNRVLDTVDRTIAGLTGERLLDDEDFFTGLAEAKDRLRQDLNVRYGPAAADRLTDADHTTHAWTRADYDRAAARAGLLYSRMSEARSRGVAPGASEVFDLVAEHYREVRRLWPADAAAYRALADLITDNPEQRAPIAAIDQDLPDWLADAIRIHATSL
ncbi:MerR family transcriptional regulator [Actinomadura harenae]|uniref:MerR family transcriptional regulator n=1 Tax=Actinomadura harenae TaxID=2483351 RepID=A0A3M2M0I4_9ACTN|nr:MerR family transcriptional regulator [Actinomadura harenae]RMI41885.1 MerR family transcriptional regulator [Actinomadura harenae]